MTETIAFTTRLREQSSTFHSQAESSPMMKGVFSGDVTRADYAQLLGQLRWVYAALDSAAARLRGDARVGGLLDPRLDRTRAIAADLAALHAPLTPPNAIACEYVDRIVDVSLTSPTGLVAHHYVRYLGDLSGGFMIAKALETGLGLTADDGLQFFQFDLGSVVEFKRRYREQLDALALDATESDAFIAEVGRAYNLNTSLFASLAPVA